MLMACFHKKLSSEGVKVFGLDPDFLATSLTQAPEEQRAQGAVEPEVGASVVLGVLQGKRDSDVGKVVSIDGVGPW